MEKKVGWLLVPCKKTSLPPPESYFENETCQAMEGMRGGKRGKKGMKGMKGKTGALGGKGGAGEEGGRGSTQHHPPVDSEFAFLESGDR